MLAIRIIIGSSISDVLIGSGVILIANNVPNKLNMNMVLMTLHICKGKFGGCNWHDEWML